jgi:hypothetical protein
MKDSKTKVEESTRLAYSVREEGDDGEVARSETPSLLSYTLRYVSFVEVGSVCRFALSEEGGDGETTRSETPSLLSYTVRYVSFATGVL